MEVIMFDISVRSLQYMKVLGGFQIWVMVSLFIWRDYIKIDLNKPER